MKGQGFIEVFLSLNKAYNQVIKYQGEILTFLTTQSKLYQYKFLLDLK